MLLAVAVASLSIKNGREPKHKAPKLHHLAPPIADQLVRAALDLQAGADARLVLTNLLSEEDRSYLNQTPTDMRGRAKGRMSAADRALVLALLGRPGGSYHPGKVRGVRRHGRRSIVKKNCLVFGLPGDGKRWTDAGHRLVFLDHREDAVRTARDEGLNAYVVRYASAPKSSWEASPYATDPKKLIIDAPSYDFRDEAHIFWDLVIVDGPDSVQGKVDAPRPSPARPRS